MPRVKHTLLVSLAAGGGFFLLDRLTKSLFANASAVLIPNLLALTVHQNHGLLANAPVPYTAILVLTGVISLGVLILLIRSLRHDQTRDAIAWACILAGALGNLTDRIAWGFVFDWILLFNRSVINVADIAIGLGILLLLVPRRHQA